MTARCYELGLIPCSKNKNPLGVTAQTLYRSSPFSLMMRHAGQRCQRILIMSAKYGLIRPEDRVANYDSYLPTLTLYERQCLGHEMELQWWQHHLKEVPPAHVLCYLPKAYYDFLGRVCHYREWAEGIHRPYKNCPSLTMMRILSYEIKGFESPGLARR